MARGNDNKPASDWKALRAQFATGSVKFVKAIRESYDSNELGEFAREWYLVQSPEARKLLFRYLSEPLNAIRHEPLVKRLFKFAEAARDHEVMAHFLVALDRSVRKKITRKKKYRYGNIRGWGKEVQAIEIEQMTNVYKQLPRHQYVERYLKNQQQAKWFLARHDMNTSRIFSNRTRNYLRRRAWRYFRKLGRQFPNQYIQAISTALKMYTDEDVKDGLSFLSNWGLVHALFHFSPALVAKPSGWVLAKNKTLADLAPEPMFKGIWKANPNVALDLIPHAKCRPVRQWAMRWLSREAPAVLDNLPLETLLEWLKSKNADIAEFAAVRLKTAKNLDSVTVERWLAILENCPAEALTAVCELLQKAVSAEKLSFFECIRLAKMRPTPVARLGLAFLKQKKPASDAQVEATLSVRDALAEPVRAELCRWAANALSEYMRFKPEWVTEFLDSRHEDVRFEGMAWLEREPRAMNEPVVWQRMLESPYDDIRLEVVSHLERVLAANEGKDIYAPELVRLLWATVLLNIHRGGRKKPLVVQQIIQRLTNKPAEAKHLLPVLAVAVRSSRSTEFRTGLTAVVRLQETMPKLEKEIRSAFPELVREAI